MKLPPFQTGDEVCGKDTPFRGRITRVIDYKRVMVWDNEMELEIEMLATSLAPVRFNNLASFPEPPSSKPVSLSTEKKTARIDLHWEKIPSRFRKNATHRLQDQLDYLEYEFFRLRAQGVSRVQIIHGKGSGMLAGKVQAWLNRLPVVKEKKLLKSALEPPHGIEVVL